MHCILDICTSNEDSQTATTCDRLERAVRGSSDGLWEWNLLTNRVWYAPRFLELLGFDRSEFPDALDSWSRRLHPEDRKITWQALQNHLLDRHDYDVKYRLLTKSGIYRWFRARGTAYRNENGRPVCMAGSIRNIDALVQAEQELREKEAQILRQQKLDALGSLASGISHEFNNLLQTICGYTKFAMESLPADSQANDDLKLVLSASERATQLTRQLLDFSRTEEVNVQPAQIDKIVQELVMMLRPLLPNNITLRLKLNDGSKHVLIDASNMQQALLNLCINACDAMPDGGVLLIESEVVNRAKMTSGEYVRILVVDTGTGISPEALSHIFEPFYTTKEVGKGTGLGLAVTYGVVEQVGGRIECTSHEGEGTTFEICLPVVSQAEPTESLATLQESSREFTQLDKTHTRGH